MKFRLTIAFLLVSALAVFGGFAWTASGTGEFALAEYSVRNLSCGSCVQNIRAAFEGVEGVGEVDVIVTSGRARVEYVPSVVSADSIAGRIDEAGYPATLTGNLSAADYRSLRENESSLADRFVGRIGERLISRSEFAEVLSLYEERGTVPKKGLLKAVWEEILQREILLNAAEKNDVVVQDGEVDLLWGKMQRDNTDFESLKAGGEGIFRKRLKEDMIIQRNIEDHVLKGESDESRRRLKLERWYRDLASTVPVIIYDPPLKATVEGGGKGCGGSCCG